MTRKRGVRRTERAAAFHAKMAEIKPLLPYRYGELCRVIDPTLDAKVLRYAVAGRAEYWEALPALRMVAGLDELPKNFRFNRSAQPVAA